MTSKPEKSGRLRRGLRRAATIAGTLGTMAAAGLIVAMASGFLAGRAADVVLPDAADLTPVEVAVLTYEDSYSVMRSFSGQIEAAEEVTLSFELSGRLSDLTVREGEPVTKGQVIARLDTALLEADARRLDASRAALRDELTFAESRVERATRLRESGFSSQEALDQAVSTRDALRNRMAEISAALDMVQINISKSVVTAPFSGRVGTQHADPAVTLSPGQPVLTLIRTTAPEVRVGLPVAIDVVVGSEVTVSLGGHEINARLRQIRPDLDPVTRTRTALFTIENKNAMVFGQTATLQLPVTVEAQGAWVPVDALKEGAGSQWTVYLVENDTLEAASVELIHMQGTRAFIRGSFEQGALAVISGAHRVVPGQRVRPMTGES
ncbi:efflux RND transporter periplasmic adaptor subunit [uncultured Roseobacter sp.]|uniref:efflux RND transporter periplasmic adaptor subunit n=1 Tax=uncultured Roseobacter sp. TaxID=114847 RepID=UPI00260FFED6|nr:efflux RND transporter periplasmic adaptor subunit [uncultured Roseobacter sp.]